MVQSITFIVPGTPVAKARPRTTITVTGRVKVYTHSKTADAEANILACYRALNIQAFPQTTPLVLWATFFFVQPKRGARSAYPLGRPDLDNLLKTILDALNSWAFQDDALIVSIMAEKRWASVGEGARTEITISIQS